jgi:hypothetical protein
MIGGTCCLHHHHARGQHAGGSLLPICYILVSCLAYSLILKMRQHQLTFNTLHGVITQKTGLFKTTAVKISNPKLVRQLQKRICLEVSFLQDDIFIDTLANVLYNLI